MLLLEPYRSEWPLLPLRTIISSWSMLLPRATSESMALMHPRSLLISMISIMMEKSEDRAAQRWIQPLTNCLGIRGEVIPLAGARRAGLEGVRLKELLLLSVGFAVAWTTLAPHHLLQVGKLVPGS